MTPEQEAERKADQVYRALVPEGHLYCKKCQGYAPHYRTTFYASPSQSAKASFACEVCGKRRKATRRNVRRVAEQRLGSRV